MYRPKNPPFNAPPSANLGPPYGPRPFKRPHTENVQPKDGGNSSQSQTYAPPPGHQLFAPVMNKWNSLLGNFERNDKDKQTSSDKKSSPERKRFHLYDPFESVKSNNDDHLPPEQPHGNSVSRGRWEIDANQTQRVTPKPALFPQIHQQTDSTERVGYSSLGGTMDHNSTAHRPEASTAVRLSPPPTQRNYKPGYSGADQVPLPRPEGNKESSRKESAPRINLISCDLCEVELANGQELEEHLDSKTHWDTLEHIQKHNNYDDLSIAFLQDVMLYKSRKSSRAIEDTALQALQDYDHMTKMEMFHCAACKAFVPTSALAVQNHITSPEHMTNTKEFEARQKCLCLDKASTMMKELTPQFMSFAKGESPFEFLEKPAS